MIQQAKHLFGLSPEYLTYYLRFYQNFQFYSLVLKSHADKRYLLHFVKPHLLKAIIFPLSAATINAAPNSNILPLLKELVSREDMKERVNERMRSCCLLYR